ncbi:MULTISPECIES: transposase [Burkholderiaceae]|uniref:transposase n=1 Tax=Burkholderiaceae TaxID=119060 RepID=UPI000D75D81E
MPLEAGEFIRCFLLHSLPSGFHRIRHYLLTNPVRRASLARVRVPKAVAQQNGPGADVPAVFSCRHCVPR